eukprot:TRINITY_DN15792_c0_g1::TRINITY_DN15792_c0_g1_i1::g.25508::m.25508 TRINITY_DN15792_c0_g1::TRINITY_DN15792_c0_g1_i1::g.25508  ORF type:complete len:545 (-),score=3.34,TIR_2/PF13676.1/0.14 TRINITY_DN15792_c0_g1_i1:4-1638(-)
MGAGVSANKKKDTNEIQGRGLRSHSLDGRVQSFENVICAPGDSSLRTSSVSRQYTEKFQRHRRSSVDTPPVSNLPTNPRDNGHIYISAAPDRSDSENAFLSELVCQLQRVPGLTQKIWLGDDRNMDRRKEGLRGCAVAVLLLSRAFLHSTECTQDTCAIHTLTRCSYVTQDPASSMSSENALKQGAPAGLLRSRSESVPGRVTPLPRAAYQMQSPAGPGPPPPNETPFDPQEIDKNDSPSRTSHGAHKDRASWFHRLHAGPSGPIAGNASGGGGVGGTSHHPNSGSDTRAGGGRRSSVSDDPYIRSGIVEADHSEETGEDGHSNSNSSSSTSTTMSQHSDILLPMTNQQSIFVNVASSGSDRDSPSAPMFTHPENRENMDGAGNGAANNGLRPLVVFTIVLDPVSVPTSHLFHTDERGLVDVSKASSLREKVALALRHMAEPILRHLMQSGRLQNQQISLPPQFMLPQPSMPNAPPSQTPPQSQSHSLSQLQPAAQSTQAQIQSRNFQSSGGAGSGGLQSPTHSPSSTPHLISPSSTPSPCTLR